MKQISANKIRPIIAEDLPALKLVIDSSELFPSEMLDDMIADYLQQKNEKEFWLTYEEEQPIAIAYFAPERMTSGTYNLLLIAVLATHRSKGVGKMLLQYIENFLQNRGERVLLVETSGLAEFERTRAFYRDNDYDQEARIREYYSKGEDKIVFWKSLSK